MRRFVYDVELLLRAAKCSTGFAWWHYTLLYLIKLFKFVESDMIYLHNLQLLKYMLLNIKQRFKFEYLNLINEQGK